MGHFRELDVPLRCPHFELLLVVPTVFGPHQLSTIQCCASLRGKENGALKGILAYLLHRLNPDYSSFTPSIFTAHSLSCFPLCFSVTPPPKSYSACCLLCKLFQHLLPLSPSYTPANSLTHSHVHTHTHACSSVLLSIFLSFCRSLSLRTTVRSHGERRLAESRLAAIATGTLPLPQVSLATGSLALL